MLAHSRRIVSKTDALQGNAYTKTSWLWCLQLSKLQKIFKSNACGCIFSKDSLLVYKHVIILAVQAYTTEPPATLPRLHVWNQAIILHEKGTYDIIQGSKHQIEKCKGHTIRDPSILQQRCLDLDSTIIGC